VLICGIRGSKHKANSEAELRGILLIKTVSKNEAVFYLRTHKTKNFLKEK